MTKEERTVLTRLLAERRTDGDPFTLLNSLRGKIVVSRALALAIETLKAREIRELVDIADMVFLREAIFDFPFEEIEAAMRQAEAQRAKP